MGYILTYLFFFLLPIAIIAFFVTSLVLYIIAKNRNKKTPGSYNDVQMQTRKLCLIFSSILLGLLVLAALSVFSLFFMAIAFM